MDMDDDINVLVISVDSHRFGILRSLLVTKTRAYIQPGPKRGSNKKGGPRALAFLLCLVIIH